MSDRSINIETEVIKRRYNRLAGFYDIMEEPIERLRFGVWRKKFQEKITGPMALEIGVGTGKNMLYYPSGIEVTAIDFSPRMLEKARKKSASNKLNLNLVEMDVQQLDFPDQTFDTVFAAFVFCSVPDPVLGLTELRRVVKPEGRLLLLEHMRPGNSFFGTVFDLVNPIIVRMMGANVNRRTVENVKNAGWDIEVEDHLSGDVVRWIEAKPG